MSGREAIVWGVLGGLLAALFGWWKLRHELKAQLPPYFRSGFYWFLTSLMIVSGGLIPLIYVKSGVVLSPLVAVNVGATAPFIIGSLTASPPRVNAGAGNL